MISEVHSERNPAQYQPLVVIVVNISGPYTPVMKT